MPVRVASIALHSTSSTRLRARATVAEMISSTSASDLRIWCARWMGDVETNVWMRPRLGMTHGLARAIDVGVDGAREPRDRGAFFTRFAIADTASKSPVGCNGEARPR